MGAVGNNRSRINKGLIFAGVLVSLIASCSNPKYSQCQSIIAIANEANERAKKITVTSSEKDLEVKNWLTASNIMATAAQKLEDLPTTDSLLVNYQKELATVFKSYSQAIDDAVQAREDRNLSALKIARQDAIEADQLNQNLVKKINSYCSFQ